jgi:hypothetical protein
MTAVAACRQHRRAGLGDPQTGELGYTAILRGKTGSGIAVVEIYNLR